jgi:hypothetical protein
MPMSETEKQQAQVKGPPMLVATHVMNPGSARIGRLFGNVTLPRAVRVVDLVAAGGGALFGIVIGLLITKDLSGVLYGGALFGMAGYLAVTYSPLEGETLARYLGLSIRASRDTITYKGSKVQVSIGICPIEGAGIETLRLSSSCVDIPPSQYDLRGVRFSTSARNLDQVGSGYTWVPGADQGVGVMVEGRGPDPVEGADETSTGPVAVTTHPSDEEPFSDDSEDLGPAPLPPVRSMLPNDRSGANSTPARDRAEAIARMRSRDGRQGGPPPSGGR